VPIEEHVVLLDEGGNEIGTAPKATVHHAHTPLHLAVSCYVFNHEGDVLVTRRALSKSTWAGVWTNSFCGHPLPGEPVLSALNRRAQTELGLGIRSLRLALPQFRYRATDASGIVENEICPVYFATTAEEPTPNRREVSEHTWVSTSRLSRAVQATPWAFSPWMVLQLEQLEVFRD
jgi:isopentenyl-diphosphate delta-isomerase